MTQSSVCNQITSTRRISSLYLFILLIFFLNLFPSISVAHLSRAERARKDPNLFDFPHIGYGDPDHSFMHPYIPSGGGDPINHWFQLGSTTISRSKSGRDVVRLTGAGQGNQGILYNSIKTETNNINGYIDIEIETVRESHEPADGMGFFFVKDIPKIGSAMGITEKYQGLGIIIDTFSNSRTRHTPYLYAYVSDGTKPWNPDTDGADTEVAKGCQLELNTQIRIYIQFIDGDLHVGVAMNPRTPHRWHTCFKVSNVNLPFRDGGYLAFAGETGHFYALHQIHDVSFNDESSHKGSKYDPNYEEQNYGEGYSAGVAHGNDQQTKQTQQKQQQQQQQHQEPQRSKPLIDSNRGDATTRVHKGVTGTETLAGSLDLQVYEIFNSMSSALKGLHDKESEESKLRLNGVRDVTGHLIQEMQKQQSEMTSLIQLMRHLKDSTKELHEDTDKFLSQVRTLHGTMATLIDHSERQINTNGEVKEKLSAHHQGIYTANKSGGNGIIILFFVVQLLIFAGIFVMYKMNATSKKLGRMV